MCPARAVSAIRSMSKVVKLGGNGCSDNELALIASNVLKTGKVVAVPTDTIYGIAALSQNTDAIQNIYRIKARGQNRPLSICVGHVSDIPKWGKVVFPKDLLKALLPGPVTVLMERQPCLNPKLNPGIALIGIRIPSHHFMQLLCSLCDSPLALTSANISSETSTLSIEEFKDLWPSLGMVVDGGTLGHLDPNRLGSTVVDLSEKGHYQIVRPGCALETTKKILESFSLKELERTLYPFET